MCICVCLRVCECVCVYARLCECGSVCESTCVCVCLRVCLHMWVRSCLTFSTTTDYFYVFQRLSSEAVCSTSFTSSEGTVPTHFTIAKTSTFTLNKDPHIYLTALQPLAGLLSACRMLTARQDPGIPYMYCKVAFYVRTLCGGSGTKLPGTLGANFISLWEN